LSDPSDQLLSGFCCSLCPSAVSDEPRSLLLVNHPPSSANTQTSQPAEDLDDLVAELEGLNTSKKGGKKSKAAKAKGNQPNTPPPPPPPPPPTSTPPTTADPSALYCQRCGHRYELSQAEAVARTAAELRERADGFLAGRHFQEAGQVLRNVLAECEAISQPRKGQRGAGLTGGGGSARLHPLHSVVFNTHAALVNCARREGDLMAAVKHLRHLLSCMEVVFPPNFPERADYLFALADTLRDLIQRSGSRPLPKKVLDGFKKEMKAAWKECAEVRNVCFGPESPTTAEARMQLGEER